MSSRQPPSDFNTGSEVRSKRWHTKAYKTYKCPVLAQLCRVQSEIVLAEMFFDPLDERIALRSHQTRRHKFHHTRIRIQPAKRFAVPFSPTPQQQSVSLNQQFLLALI